MKWKLEMKLTRAENIVVSFGIREKCGPELIGYFLYLQEYGGKMSAETNEVLYFNQYYFAYLTYYRGNYTLRIMDYDYGEMKLEFEIVL